MISKSGFLKQFSNISKYSVAFMTFLIVVSMCENVKAMDNQYSDLPPPPSKPERFTSKQQLKDYLVKLHEYYAIIGRPRFGRSQNIFNEKSPSSELGTDAMNNLVPVTLAINVMDLNGDGFLSKTELRNFVKLVEDFL